MSSKAASIRPRFTADQRGVTTAKSRSQARPVVPFQATTGTVNTVGIPRSKQSPT